jgi:hypothetical protein
MWGKYSILREPLTKGAARLGYALAVHGSCNRDLDLVAIPWIDDAEDEKLLVEMICKETKKIVGIAYIPPGIKFPRKKPFRRYGWSICLGYGKNCPYIDLSVIYR